ncbi:PREDICTED: immunoglobulin iota chain [Chrysochloris asiatica]|uniref:immunoglobulin iota chain n=1 Tax=Chrysochloris asiatica TaxID=185453 RepID=UPI0003F12C57|nr:PREDICTED: immunoglobulin iota chain [Chrysochloris asiatica]
MAWIPLLLLTFHCTGSLSAQPVLTQSPSTSVSPGASAKLTCTLSSEHSTYIIEWYQQRPGKSPRFVMVVGSSGMEGSRGDGIPNRFLGSSSGADRYLTITSIQSEDEADYICGVSHSNG